jgi:WhiB family redox-sensing transcriptional regulator
VPVLAGDCRTADPELLFPPDGERLTAQRRRVAKARAICAGCPVRRQCYQAADARDEPWGIWGGVDFAERRQQRRRAS